MRILIIKPSSLGDVIHALPAVNLIRRRHPYAEISWLINDTLVSLLKNSPVIDELIPFPRQQFGRLTQFPKFCDFLDGLRIHEFDLVVDLQGLFRSGLMAWATNAPRRVGLSDAREGAQLFYTEIVKTRRLHAVHRYLLTSRYLDCESGPVEFPLGSSAEDELVVEKLLPKSRPLIAVNPSARWGTKLWGADNFAALLDRLPADQIVLTGSASEAGEVEKIGRGRCNLAGKTDLAQLAELYRHCALLITNDSGPMHLAAAVGTPVVAIFGPTDPNLTGPYGKRHIVIRSGISCSPCLKPYCAHVPQMECMDLVSVEQVLAAANPFLV